MGTNERRRFRTVLFRCAPALLAILTWSWAQAPLCDAALSAGRIEENDPSVVYTGVWYPQHRADLSGGSIVEAPYSVGTATLPFNGTGVRWIGFKAVWGGIAQVYLDGVLTATVDTYAPSEQAQAVMYTVGGLSPGPHTLTIKVTGTWNPAGCCSWVVVDAFDVF